MQSKTTPLQSKPQSTFFAIPQALSSSRLTPHLSLSPTSSSFITACAHPISRSIYSRYTAPSSILLPISLSATPGVSQLLQDRLQGKRLGLLVVQTIEAPCAILPLPDMKPHSSLSLRPHAIYHKDLSCRLLHLNSILPPPPAPSSFFPSPLPFHSHLPSRFV